MTLTSTSARFPGTAARAPGAPEPVAARVDPRDSRWTTSRAARSLQVALGAIWLLDGALQLQPSMFTRVFVTGVLLPSAEGQSGFIARPALTVAHVISPHIAWWNGLFAANQLAIGLAIGLAALTRRAGALRVALAASIAWSAMVWWLGEGLGGVLSGASPLAGAPGAVLLYLVIGLLLWPGRRQDLTAPLLGGRFARGTWLALWALSAFLLLEPANQGTRAVSSVIDAAGSGEPALLHRLLDAVATSLQGSGPWLDSALALAMLAIGIGVALGRLPRLLLGSSMVLSGFIWVFGEAFGGVLTGQGTDPNSGPLWILLALCMWAGLGAAPSHAGVRAVGGRLPAQPLASAALRRVGA